jgi:hypothetical protein
MREISKRRMRLLKREDTRGDGDANREGDERK